MTGNDTVIKNTMEEENIEEIKKKAEKFETQYNKLKQEFKDYIEASRKNEEIKRQEMKIDFVKRLLVVADSLNRVSETDNNFSCDIVKNHSENIKKNIDVIYSQLLSASGLTQIDPAAGDKFDENMHIAIGLEYGIAYPENSIFRVIRKGYRIGNSVVRPSEVIISKNPIEAKVMKPSLWDRFLRWINPSSFQFVEINQKIDELESLQKEKVEKVTHQLENLTQEISSLKNIIMEFEKKFELKEHEPPQHEDMLDDTGQYQENETFENNKNYLNIKEEDDV